MWKIANSMQVNSNYNPLVSDAAATLIDEFEKLSTDDKLAALYFIYEKMGTSITPAAPNAADPELAPMLIGEYLELSDDKQLEIMRDIVNRKDTDYSRAYGALSENNQLLVWYIWADKMGSEVVDIPQNAANETINKLVGRVEEISFEDQISILRELATNMGYTGVKPIPTQAETGKTSSL